MLIFHIISTFIHYFNLHTLIIISRKCEILYLVLVRQDDLVTIAHAVSFVVLKAFVCHDQAQYPSRWLPVNSEYDDDGCGDDTDVKIIDYLDVPKQRPRCLSVPP